MGAFPVVRWIALLLEDVFPMTRVATSNYAGSPDTTFEWATAGSDRFSRELDLYRMSQALELHDHTAGKGLSVGRVLNLLIDTAQLANGAVTAAKLGNDAVTAVAVALDAIGALELADNAVDTAAIQNLAVTLGKLAANSVDNTKLVAGTVLAHLGYTPVNKAGDTMGGNLTFPNGNGVLLKDTGGTARIGLMIDVANNVLIGNNAINSPVYVYGRGISEFLYVTSGSVSNVVWHSGNDGAGSTLDAGLVIGKIPTATPAAGAIPVADGSGKLDSWITSPAAFPSGVGAYVATAAAIPSGWARDNGGVAGTVADGRYLVGAGAATGISNAITYTEATNYGSDTQHTHTSAGHTHGASALGLGGTSAASTGVEDGGSGADDVSADGHQHNPGSYDVTGATDSGTDTNGNTAWQTPSRAVVWMKKS